MTAMTKPAPKRAAADLSTKKNAARPRVSAAYIRDAAIELDSGFFWRGETKGRTAVARVLRSEEPLSRIFRDILADLIQDCSETLRIVRRARRRGRQLNPNRKIGIAMMIQILKSKDPERKQESVIAEVAAECGLKRTQVLEYWKKYKGLVGGNAARSPV